MLPKKMTPNPDGRIGRDSDIANQYQNVKDGLLECRQCVKVDCVQTCIGHCTGAEEDGVDIAKLEMCVRFVTVAIDTATIDDDG